LQGSQRKANTISLLKEEGLWDMNNVGDILKAKPLSDELHSHFIKLVNFNGYEASNAKEHAIPFCLDLWSDMKHTFSDNCSLDEAMRMYDFYDFTIAWIKGRDYDPYESYAFKQSQKKVKSIANIVYGVFLAMAGLGIVSLWLNLFFSITFK
jgi:hypothetical protein